MNWTWNRRYIDPNFSNTDLQHPQTLLKDLLQSWKPETTFHYCYGVKSTFKLVWMESTSPCNSLNGYCTRWSGAAAHWSTLKSKKKTRNWSGSFSQRNGSAIRIHTTKNDTDAEHWLKGNLYWPMRYNLQWTWFLLSGTTSLHFPRHIFPHR